MLDNTRKLEKEFNKHRPFGDERDLKLFLNFHNHPGKIICFIHKKAPNKYPKLAFDPSNLVTMCSNCVEEYIENFKEYNKIHRFEFTEN